MLGDALFASRDSEPTERAIDHETKLTLISNERRRLIITILEERGATPRSDLAREMADRQTGERKGDEYKKRYVGIYQSHLPKMEKHGVVAQTDGDVVRPGEAFAEVAELLADVEAHQGGSA